MILAPPSVSDMTKKVNDLYLCEECGLGYRERAWAEKCEMWCKTHKSCSLEIMSHAAKAPNLKL
ncbi:MAG: hypothetical protein C4K47_10955 [Candidatus Thorarchaeota archaeon]|nr:MAG: hypothetical protein C4K47_10955 [Candidatus Thorarchaeota archaeon]